MAGYIILFSRHCLSCKKMFEFYNSTHYEKQHTGPSFNTDTENTIQVSKFKRIAFEKKWRISMGANSLFNLRR